MAPKPKIPRAPATLKSAGKSYWKTVFTNFVVEDHHIDLLRSACEQLDRAAGAREVILRDGLTTTDRFKALKAHPCVEIERQAHSTFLKMSRELGLDVITPESRGPSRPGTAGRR
jgi:P27 family predicted phage terminase small subunit